MAPETTLGALSPSQIGGLIPHFFYDVIGRIVPGVYLLVGLLVLGWVPPGVSSVQVYLNRFGGFPSSSGISPPPDFPAGFLLFVLTVGLLAFVTAGYFLGFLMGAISYYVGKLFWKQCTPHELFDSLGGGEKQRQCLEEAFNKQFGFPVTGSPQSKENAGIDHCSHLCAYFVCAHNRDLGLMTTRWDAEALSSQSILLGSIVLTLIGLFEQICPSHRSATISCGWLFIFILMGVASGVSYNYHRKKRVYGRYALFQVLKSPQ